MSISGRGKTQPLPSRTSPSASITRLPRRSHARPRVSMTPSLVLLQLFRFLLPPCLLSLIYLYLYPAFHGCSFPVPPTPTTDESTCLLEGQKPQQHNGVSVKPLDVAPFRLLVFGDPQLEGDTSLPKIDSLDDVIPHFRDVWAGSEDDEHLLSKIQAAGKEVLEVVKDLAQSARKRLDLLGNDFYLAHIYRTLHWWTGPTHVAVVGDLLGSQWISDAEFERRSGRFWDRVFRRGKRVEDDITRGERVEVLGQEEWSTRVITIPGNHDIGYSGELDDDRMARYETAFGKANWAVTFQLLQNGTQGVEEEAGLRGTSPMIRLVMLNAMNLDGPVLSSGLQGQTYQHINDVIMSSAPVEQRNTLTLLLTHIPLHKPSGLCADAPYFDYYSSDDGGYMKEQNMLSDGISKQLLEGIFGLNGNPNVPGRGLGRKGLILTGHDHVGCDVYHHIPPPNKEQEDEQEPEEDGDESDWWAVKYRKGLDEHLKAEGDAAGDVPVPGLREITVRSMMGEFGGNAGLLSAWFDDAAGEWQFEIEMCPMGVQHIWWGIHVFALVVLGMGLGSVLTFLWETYKEDHLGKPGSKPGTVGKTESEKKANVVKGTALSAAAIQANGKEEKSSRKKPG